MGHNLFGEFGEINLRQITISQFLDIPVLEISKLILCQIVISEKPPNIIAAKYSRFTVFEQLWIPLHKSFKNRIILEYLRKYSDKIFIK